MQVSAASGTGDQSVLQRQLVKDQRTLSEDVAAKASQSVITADQLRVQMDQLAIEAASAASATSNGGLDVLA